MDLILLFKTMKKTSKAITLINNLLILFIFTSCGNKNETNHRPVKIKSEYVSSRFEGIYQAIFFPVNKSITPEIRGSLTIAKIKNEFAASVRLSKSPGTSLQLQHIHIGHRCPEASDDLNGDELIDAFEGSRVFKEILLPLDDDLNSQRMGAGTYPMSDIYGHYTWSREASFDQMIKDLDEYDLNLKDDIIKLNKKKFNLEGRLIVISGLSKKVELPTSVSGKGNLDPHSSFPIACGVIRKISTTPGKIDADHTGIHVSEIDLDIEREDDGANFDLKIPSPDNYGSD